MKINEKNPEEANSQESENKYEQLANLLPQIVFETDKQGILTYVNHHALTATGYTSGDFKKGIKAIDLVVPEDRDRVRNHMQRRLRGENFDNQEYLALRKDGSTYPILVYSATINRGGKPIGLRGLIVDISERKQAEIELQITEQNYRNSIDDSPLGIRIVSPKGDLMYANRAILDMYGYATIEELKDTPSRERYTPESFSQHQIRKEMRQQGKSVPSEYEIDIIRRDGQTRRLITHRKPVVWNGEIQYQAIYEDVTEREKAAEREKILVDQLHLANRLATVGEMAAGIVHEVNNPLAVVVAYSDWLMGVELPGEIKEDIEKINNAAQRAADILDKMLTFASQRGIKQEYLDIGGILEIAIEFRKHSLANNNIKIVRKYAPGLLRTMVDGGKIQQVFLNLLINAESAMKEAHNSGELSIKTEMVDNYIKISFEDNGTGISEEHISRLFNPFFTTKEVGKGTGLGLSICHGIVSEHGGKISAENNSSEGATFVIELPVLKPEVNPSD